MDARARRAALVPLLVGVVVGAMACGGAADGGAADGAEGNQLGEGPGDRLSLVETLGGLDTAGYERAFEVRDFVFPDDHGPHPGFRTEWWYVTGNLTAESGRAFGFQFTIFRSALAPTAPDGPSAWATNQAYMGHFAVTDVSGGAFHAAELFARGSGGLAGARAAPFRVWIEDWSLAAAHGEGGATAAPDPAASTDWEEAAARPGARNELEGGPQDETFPMRLTAEAPEMVVDLVLEAGKPRVFQGDRGLSQKGPEAGNASYYYAHTRMPARGEVVFEGETYRVSGLAWMDREWSTSALSAGQVGWDWFALQLADGWELMVYQLRRDDGTADPLSDGVLIDPEGRRVPLEWGREISVTPTGTWSSPVDGAEYPSGWRIRVPERGWDLSVEPVVADQELRLAFRYWEGAVRVEGSGEGGDPVTGRGYVELTGYAGPDLAGDEDSDAGGSREP